MLFHAPAAAICWSTYEAGKSFFQEINDSNNRNSVTWEIKQIDTRFLSLLYLTQFVVFEEALYHRGELYEGNRWAGGLAYELVYTDAYTQLIYQEHAIYM